MGDDGEWGWARSVGVEVMLGDPGVVEAKRLDELYELALLSIGGAVVHLRILIGAE